MYIDFNQPEAGLVFKDVKDNKEYDYYTIQCIGEEKFHPVKGFYDSDRVDKIYTYYKTYKELIITEVYEEIIKYCNNYFKKENALYLIDYNGLTEAFVASKNEEDVDKIKKLQLKKHQNIDCLKYPLFTQTA